MQKIKNNGTKKFAKFPLDLAIRRVAGRAGRRRFGAAAALFFIVVLRVRVAIIFFHRRDAESFLISLPDAFSPRLQRL